MSGVCDEGGISFPLPHHTPTHHIPPPGTTLPGGHDMASMSPGSTSPAGMLAAHLLAAVLAGLWLAYGERAVFRIPRALAGRLRAPLLLGSRLLLLHLLGLPVTPQRRPRVRVRRERRRPGPRQLFLTHTITSRGPPPATAVL
ncbi:hypothetical protein [Streptomyces sp. NPDC051567]|uniref:hypothetical protein n=1 Tax=Streptomyces sp. NPDC051567 TaxID=3365660 RepID=UPI0037B3E40C